LLLLLFLTHIAHANDDKTGALGAGDPCLGGAGWPTALLSAEGRGKQWHGYVWAIPAVRSACWYGFCLTPLVVLAVVCWKLDRTHQTRFLEVTETARYLITFGLLPSQAALAAVRQR